MTVRCKVTCTSVKKSQHWDKEKGFLYEAEFAMVTSGSEENRKFFEATPFGSVKLGSYRDDTFTPGQDYYLDISPAGE